MANSPAIDVTFTIRPARARRITGRTCRQTRITPNTFVLNCACAIAIGVSSIAPATP